MPAQPHSASERKPSRLGWLLLKAMNKRGYESQIGFARDLQVSPSTVSRWIFDSKRPSAEMLQKISVTLGIDIGDLLDAMLDVSPPKEPTVGRSIDPLAFALSEFLAGDSPLSDDEKQRLRMIVEHILQPYWGKSRRKRAG